MAKPLLIRKVAVLGAGVMGAQIAAHCVNANLPTLLFDLKAKEGKGNTLVEKAIMHLAALKPSPLATKDTASLIEAKNYDDHLAELSSCDLIIEAIAERLDWKEALYQRISPVLSEHAILVSNTSGLSINTLADVLPSELRPRFCGVHLFNPPRYMHLAELIPAKETTGQLIDDLESWLTSRLGKGVIIAKDTPNFIANRIGVFSLLMTLHHAEHYELSIDELDALTGTLIGRPKSATCRTLDVVGLDTMEHVVNTMKQLKNDPWHFLFKLPGWIEHLIQNGHLGQKTGQGIYRKHGKTIEVYRPRTQDYHATSKEPLVSQDLITIMAIKDSKARMKALLASTHQQARFLSACFRDLFHYCAFHLGDIADTVRDVDLAMRWGFGWQEGPFESWQQVGIELMRAFIQDKGIAKKAALPSWVNENTPFYTDKGAYSPLSKEYKPRSKLAVYQHHYLHPRLPFEPSFTLPTLFENKGVCLSQFKNDIALLSFKSKANSIGQYVLDGLNEALAYAEKSCRGLIIYQYDSNTFSAGANLQEVSSLIAANKMAALETMLADFQCLMLRLKYSSLPVVAAVRGKALGGGCELMMHCDSVIASFESYIGLVEVGVGLLPGGGGCKEMAMRAAQTAHTADLLHFIQPAFEQIAMAVVSQSAPDALRLGYLRESDTWVMHPDDVLYAALMKMESLLAANYSPPIPKKIQVAGREGHARLQAGLVNWLEGKFISAHDYFIANQVAEVLCGGDINQGEWVDEPWMLAREKEAFLRLASMSLSQARISSLLETGKPLRN